MPYSLHIKDTILSRFLQLICDSHTTIKSNHAFLRKCLYFYTDCTTLALDECQFKELGKEIRQIMYFVLAMDMNREVHVKTEKEGCL